MASALNLVQDGQRIHLVDYDPHTGIRLLVITALAVGGITALALTGQFSHLSNWFHPDNLWKPLTCGAAGLFALGSTAFIINEAKKGLAQGKIVGNEHWKVCLVKIKQFTCQHHIDLSGLDENGTGVAKLYFKEPFQASSTGVQAAITMPIYVLTVMVYNLLRLVVIPFYILGQMIRDGGTEKNRFSLLDIPQQMALSVGRVLQAPLYGIAMFFASLYAVVDPMNGIKLGSAIEYLWNDEVPMRNSGVWMMGTRTFQEWRWEGGGEDPEKMGQNGFYFAGSWLAYNDVICNEWQVTKITGVGGVEVDEIAQLISQKEVDDFAALEKSRERPAT